ncbi:MAG: histidinol-phosphate transaminase [Clostridium sp.]|nr:histidinol-phosphate transaminase [Clostridium sp.]MCM1170792.1 histidinol-phosphate transaminase [Clostridium sp.]MCM1209532.1 histidinol-phosphate transaminase [Ruminococcus sp.]
MEAWEKNVRRVVPYVPGEQPKADNIIKLNTNENPYPPAPAVVTKSLNLSDLRLYPDPGAELLVKKIAEYHGLAQENVFVGVGSDDVLAMSFMTFFNSEKEILFPDVTYSFYDVWADLLKIPYKAVPVTEEFRLRREDYYVENGGIIFPNPNAPTGIAEPASFVEDILKANRDVVVIVDEAYVDFGGESVLPLIDAYDNLLVVRTFSKSRSMAGIRIGYAMGNAKLIQYLNDVKYSFNSYTMNIPSIILGAESLEDDAYFKETVAKVVSTRRWFMQEIEKLGFISLPSAANFVFSTHKVLKAKYIFEEAKKAGIYVRYFDKPRIDNYLRITIGTDEQMEIFLEFLKKLV